MWKRTRLQALNALSCVLLLSLAACGGGERAGTSQNRADAESAANAASASRPSPVAAGGDLSKLGGEIERLERLVERNPGDDAAREELAGAHVLRANALRDARRMKEALLDYQRALRINPDNEEAQKSAAEIAPLVEGTPQEGEYGEPPPLPITPNVTGAGENASPTPTPKKP